MKRRLPSGRVTFAFTDVVGSTRSFIEHGELYAEAVQAVQARVAHHVHNCGGVVVSTEGDGAMLAFSRAQDAVAALCALQEELEQPREGLRLRLRAGAHTGDAEPIGDLYVALPVYVAARLSSTASAGQVIVSQDVIDELDGPVGEELGTYILKDVTEPVTLWRVFGDKAPPKAVPARRTNVADPHTSFVGREAEIRVLHKLLSSAPGLVTVAGAGGLGKTRLVSEYALRRCDDMPAGIWLVELASLTDPAGTLPEVAATLGLTGSASLGALVGELQRRGELVLILDNCEHLVDEVADLATGLLAACPALRLLCTSREPLELEGEHVVRLPPLATDSATGPGEAELLFISRAEAAGAVVPANELPAVTELCQLLDGLPLALELAAARAPLMPVRSLVEGLRDGDVVLARRGGASRQRSLAALVGWSLELLSEADREALFALAVFPGRFSAAMAEEILAAIPGVRRHAYADLARRSLLDLDGAEYRMLVSVGDVARRELAARPDTRRAALDALFAWAAADSMLSIELVSSDQLRALEVAAEWGLENELPGRGRVLSRIAHWALEGQLTPGTLALAHRVLDEPLLHDDEHLRLNLAAMRLVSGRAMTVTGAIHTDRVRELVPIARSVGDPEILRIATGGAAMFLDRAGLHDQAEPLHRECVQLSEGDALDHCRALHDLGVCYHLQGRLGDAESTYRHALRYGSSNFTTSTDILVDLGEVMLDAGRYDEAAAQLRTALQAMRERRRVASAWALALLAEAEARRGALDEATALAEQAERELLPLCANDPSLRSALDRMRAAFQPA